MSDGTITRKDIITDEALNWGNEYKQTLEAAIGKNKEFVAGILEIHEANKLLRGSIDQKQFTENSKKINEESQKTIAIWKEQIQLENALIATKKKNELATESTNRELTKQRILLSEQNKAVKQEAQNQLGLVTVYQKVQNKLNALGKEYSDLSIRKNLGAKLTDQEIKRYEFLEKKITTYDQALKLTDATQGKHQRNVGNYASGFNSLNNSVNQITREMPAFANSMNTGFMAISNNIPAFFDALNGIKQKNIELAKSGQPTKSMLSEVGGALFSVQSLMSIGVTLLTIYGARLVEWAANSLKTSKAIDQMALSTETLNKAFEDTNVSKAMEDVNQLGINIQLAKDGFLDKDKVVEQYNETIGKTTGLVSNLNDAEKELTENGDAYIKMTLYKAAANLALEEAAKQSLEAEKTRLKSLKEYAGQSADLGVSVGSSAPGYDPTAAARVAKKDIEAQKQRKKDEIKISEDAAQANINIAKKFQSDAAKIAKNFNFNFFGDNNNDSKKAKATKKTSVSDTTFELEKQRLERTIAINNDIVKDSERTDQERLKSLENSENAQIELITKSKENQLKLTGETFNKELKEGNKTSSGLIQLRKNYEADKLKISEDASNKITDIETKTAEEIAKINEFNAKFYEDNIKRGLANIEISNNEKLAAEEKRFQDELALGFENDKAKEKAAENHEKALFNIKKDGIIATTRLQINALNDEIEAYEKKAKQDGEITQKESDFILGKRKEVSDLSVRLIQAEGTKFKENEEEKGKSGAERLGKWYAENKKVIDEITQISTETLGALTDLGNAFTAREIQNIDDKISKNNEYYDKQIELAGTDERQKDLLNKEREKKNEDLEKKKRKAQEKQAKYDKAAAIAQATISAALAVLNALGTNPFLPMGPIMATLAGVLGAVQIATIIATPIPKYKLGRKGGPAEFAIVGDGGVSEVIERKSGKIDLTPKVPTLTHLGKDDIVHSSIDSYNKSMRASILASLVVDSRKISEFQANQIIESNNKELVEEMKLTRKAIEKNKTNVTVNVPKQDINHAVWAAKNKNWGQ